MVQARSPDVVTSLSFIVQVTWYFFFLAGINWWPGVYEDIVGKMLQVNPYYEYKLKEQEKEIEGKDERIRHLEKKLLIKGT